MDVILTIICIQIRKILVEESLRDRQTYVYYMYYLREIKTGNSNHEGWYYVTQGTYQSRL